MHGYFKQQYNQSAEEKAWKGKLKGKPESFLIQQKRKTDNSQKNSNSNLC